MTTPTREELMAAMAGGTALAEELPRPIAEAPPEAFGGSGSLNRNDIPAAVLAPDWMPPETRWPELNGLRATPHSPAPVGQRGVAHGLRLGRRVDEEDESKAEVLKAGFAAGTEPDLPEITSDAVI